MHTQANNPPSLPIQGFTFSSSPFLSLGLRTLYVINKWPLILTANLIKDIVIKMIGN